MSRTHFVVLRRNWRPAGETGGPPVAEDDARAREGAARTKVNPFLCGATWTERSRFPEAVFRDFLQDAGIEPPAVCLWYVQPERPPKQSAGERFTDWGGWWQKHGSELTATQQVHVWEGLDRVRFFTTAEQPIREVAYAVTRIDWQYNDMWYYPDLEGGETITAYRTRERAEAECARLNGEAREQWRERLELAEPGRETDPDIDPDDLYQFDMEGRLFPGQDPFGPPILPPPRPQEDANESLYRVDEVPFYEVIEFELEEAN
ncbi:MAG TPA: hypothetical protein VEL76_01795 [Gemmataceae bacterium]|nr:hypothetical protein [Gemmataceae bacterium]